MYINTKLLESYKLSLIQYSVLCILRQNKFEDQSELLEEYEADLIYFRDNNLLEEIKAKNKSESVYKRLRISKKGQEIIDAVCTPELSPGDQEMFEYLVKMYLSHEDKERIIGNKKKVAMYVAIMRNHLGLTLHQFYYLCEFFLAEHVFTKKLENIFFDANKNRYGDFKNNIEDSSLFQFYDMRKVEVEHYWAQRIKI